MYGSLDRDKVCRILFLDIETVPCVPKHEMLEERLKHLWPSKTHRFRQYEDGADKTDEELFELKAGILAEFGKIICISIGFFCFLPDNDGNPAIDAQGNHQEPQLRIKSFYGDDEKAILEDFANMVEKHFGNPSKHSFAAHNGVEFDYPYLCRRMIINRVPLPKMLCVNGKKSWNNPHLCDTMDLWKFGDYKGSVSLDLLATCMGIDTSKNDITGADVARVYYHDKDLPRIARYCEKDVKVLAQVFCTLTGYQLPKNLVIHMAGHSSTLAGAEV